MEYRCYIVGDAVAEPGALLRRLLHQSFPAAEQRTLAQHSLLHIRTEEMRGTHAYSMAVSLPEMCGPRAGSLTLPNPSMPSVDVTVQFAVITEPRELERVMLGHYTAADALTGGPGRSPRRRPASPMSSSSREFVSSEASSSATHGGAVAVGPALHAPPHAVVLLFNPFSLSSYSRLRLTWVHSLRVLRQHRQAQADYHVHQQHVSHTSAFLARDAAMRAAGVGSTRQRSAPHSVGAVFAAATSSAGSPLSPALPLSDVEAFPSVLLVATRMELTREAMEATPSIRLPSSLDVAEVAQSLQAPVYLEVGTDWDDTVDGLRAAVARGCIGELGDAATVTANATYRARLCTVARAMEAASSASGDGVEDVVEGEADVVAGAAEAAAALVAPVAPVAPVAAAAAEEGEDGGAAVDTLSIGARSSSACVSSPPSPSSSTLSAVAGSDSEDTRPQHSSSGAAARDAPLRGRQLRRHLVHALAPLLLPDPAVTPAGDGGASRTRTATLAPCDEETPAAAAVAAAAVRSAWTWRRHRRTGRCFFVERVSGRSQYTRPTEYDGPPPPSEADADGTSAAARLRDVESSAEEAPRRPAVGETTFSSTALVQPPPLPVVPSAAGQDGGAGVCSQEDVGVWRQRQQVELRRAHVQRLERQVLEAQLQAQRLRAQSEANAELRQRVVTLRAELDAQEQVFLSRVAETNTHVAAETMQTTLAVEELSASLRPATPPRTDASDSVASGVPTPGLVCRADGAMKAAMVCLQDALQRRDAAAAALAMVKERRARVAQLTRDATAEVAVLAARSAALDEALMPLSAQLHVSLATELELRGSVTALETAKADASRQRRRRLDECVAQRRHTETLARRVAQHREHLDAAQRGYTEALQTAALPPRTPRAAVMEERERLQLSLESATAQCGRTLLQCGHMLETAAAVERDLRATTEQVVADRLAQERRLADAHASAVESQVQWVVQRYAAAEPTRRDSGDEGIGGELVDLAVAAAAVAQAGWRERDACTTGPLLERANAAIALLQRLLSSLLLQSATEAKLHAEADTHVSCPPAPSAATPAVALSTRWLREETVRIGSAVGRESADALVVLARRAVAVPDCTEDAEAAGDTSELQLSAHASAAAALNGATRDALVTRAALTASETLMEVCSGLAARLPRPASPPRVSLSAPC
ncbi:hypothetical protein NESM_000557700 [Novymonas esmeraldas]|uniref:WW domain-containing protein n=1 Tax=Novymonas esmeraldas TaxID=1808958 RepID=A0AAW0ERU4_9TRYP